MARSLLSERPGAARCRRRRAATETGIRMVKVPLRIFVTTTMLLVYVMSVDTKGTAPHKDKYILYKYNDIDKVSGFLRSSVV